MFQNLEEQHGGSKKFFFGFSSMRASRTNQPQACGKAQYLTSLLT